MRKISFKTWSKQFLYADSPFGDVARDIAADTVFPNYVTRSRLRAYFEKSGACYACIQVFEEMFDEYRASR